MFDDRNHKDEETIDNLVGESLSTEEGAPAGPAPGAWQALVARIRMQQILFDDEPPGRSLSRLRPPEESEGAGRPTAPVERPGSSLPDGKSQE